jgi:hypothetical protein
MLQPLPEGTSPTDNGTKPDAPGEVSPSNHKTPTSSPTVQRTGSGVSSGSDDGSLSLREATVEALDCSRLTRPMFEYLEALPATDIVSLLREAATVTPRGAGLSEGPVAAMLPGRPPPPGYAPGDLRKAAAGGECEKALALLAAGVDSNAEVEKLADWAPLHYAALGGHAAMVRLLLEHGANPAAKDRRGDTALAQAGYWNYPKIADILIAKSGGEEQAAVRASVPAPVVLPAGHDAALDKWQANGHVTIICSAPEFALGGFNVMGMLFAMCNKYSEQLKFGYDCALCPLVCPPSLLPARRHHR